MQAPVLESVGKLSLREIEIPLLLRDDDVKIKINTVGICGSDVHYYTHGHIGKSFAVGLRAVEKAK
jgi:D-xylulose reductase